jgi:hypothetical protein
VSTGPGASKLLFKTLKDVAMANFELRLEGETVGRIDIDVALLMKLIGGAGIPARVSAAHAKSAPINVAQASELVSRADKATRQFLSRLVEEGGALTWGETKHTFDVPSWSEFVEGPLKKLEKALHRVTGEKNSVLVWRVEEEWIGREKGEDEPCRLHVDGPALASLRTALAND